MKSLVGVEEEKKIPEDVSLQIAYVDWLFLSKEWDKKFNGGFGSNADPHRKAFNTP